jgi:NAD(P)-dependent dehydrogenase (short-subunit alcohol dehydrogenase family)
MNLDLTGKTALVCGSTQGIGLASAVELALLGANVTLIARNEEKLREAVEDLDTSMGQLHRYVVADFADHENVKEAIQSYLRLCPEVHILVNNTGGPSGGPIIDADTRSVFEDLSNACDQQSVSGAGSCSIHEKSGLWKDRQHYQHLREAAYHWIGRFQYHSRRSSELVEDIVARTRSVRHYLQ